MSHWMESMLDHSDGDGFGNEMVREATADAILLNAHLIKETKGG